MEANIFKLTGKKVNDWKADWTAGKLLADAFRAFWPNVMTVGEVRRLEHA